MILTEAKEAYKELVCDAYFLLANKCLPPPPYKFCYTVYPGSARIFDLGNVLPVVGKFAEDALIALGVISDDSYKIIRSIEYRIGEIDRENPRVELEITSPFEGRINYAYTPGVRRNRLTSEPI